MSLSLTNRVDLLDYSVRHGHGGKGTTFENPTGCEAVELNTALEIARGAKSNALVHPRSHRVRRRGFIMNLAVRAREYPAVLLVIQPPAHEELAQ